MYRGFDITLQHNSQPDYLVGLKKNNLQRDIIKKELSKFLDPDGEINGAELENNWFPQISADIFISHSHDDEELAVTLAGWLYIQFGLESFIDSTVWGYSDSLLRQIDNMYCMNDGQHTYNYQKRNLSTAHVHMMLCTAITKMMNHTECLFFLNTNKSFNASNIINDHKTYSPWLYYEISISKLIRQPLQNHANRKKLIKGKNFSEINESVRNLNIKYPLKMEHLKKINGNDLTKWRNQFDSEFPHVEYPLDKLYELF